MTQQASFLSYRSRSSAAGGICPHQHRHRHPLRAFNPEHISRTKKNKDQLPGKESDLGVAHIQDEGKIHSSLSIRPGLASRSMTLAVSSRTVGESWTVDQDGLALGSFGNDPVAARSDNAFIETVMRCHAMRSSLQCRACIAMRSATSKSSRS